MRKSKFSELQILEILKEADAGGLLADLFRKHGITEKTYAMWRAKYGSVSASELKRIKAENARLKRMYAELALKNDDLNRK